MTVVLGRLRLTVLGCSTAAPHPASPEAGYLVEWDDVAILFDVGPGVVRRLEGIIDPRKLTAVIVGHMHADHYLDLAPMRYLFPWADQASPQLPVYLPPGGRARLDALAQAISERPGFFDAAYAVDEYDPAMELAIGPLTVTFAPGQHYVPAWGAAVGAPDGSRLVYTGDTGPSESMIEFARGADLLMVEATLDSADEDDPRRGHLTADEAIDLATRAGVREALLVHYPPDRQVALGRSCERVGPWIAPAVAGLTRIVSPATLADRVS
ncbi:MAG: MBL fold metallo-hydrolase [Chloroflexota bacterium]